MLSAASLGLNGAAGSVGGAIELVNEGDEPCTLFGYPGMEMLGRAREVLKTTVIRGSFVTVPELPVQVVLLAPGEGAHFYFGYSEVSGGPGSCAVSSRVEVTPPNDFHSLLLDLAIQPCGGTIWVSPLTRFCPAPLGVTAPTQTACSVPDLYVQAGTAGTISAWPDFPSTIRLGAKRGIEDITWTAGLISAEGRGFAYDRAGCALGPRCPPPGRAEVRLEATNPAVCAVGVIDPATGRRQQVTTYLFTRVTETAGGQLVGTLTAVCR